MLSADEVAYLKRGSRCAWPLLELAMIQILTLNTRLLPSFAYHHQTPIDQRADELADWILHTRCDVVCLQEVFSAKAARRLIARLGPYFAHISEPRAIRLEDDGLLIASRLPFARPATSIMWRDVAHLHEAAASKGATRVVIDLIDRGVDMRLALVNLHMHADYEGRSYAAVRLLQAGQLRESLLSDIALDRANEQWGLIAIGDFNVIAERDGVSLTPEYQLLVEHLGGPRDLYRDTAPPEPGPTCGDMRIDFAMAFDRSPDDRQTPLARLIALAAEVLEAPYSDHRGLLVTVGPATPPTGTLRGLIASSAGGADVATMSLLPFPIRNIEALIVRLIERLLAAVLASEPIAQHLPRPWPKPPNEERPSWSRISRPTTLAALRETVASALTHGGLKAIGADQSTSDVKTTTGLKLVMAGIASVDGPDDTNMLSFQGGATVKRLNAALQFAISFVGDLLSPSSAERSVSEVVACARTAPGPRHRAREGH